jgi:glycosyl transferase, family 25
MGDIPVYVISLRDSEVRRRNMTERLGALGIPFQFVDAIDGRTQRLPDVFDGARVVRDGFQAEAEIACAMSHRLVHRIIVDGDSELALIFEDDADPSPDFSEALALAKTLRFDILKFEGGAWGRRARIGTVGKFAVMAGTPSLGTAAYLIQRSAAARFCALPVMDGPIDVAFGDFRLQLRVLDLEPYPVKQNGTPTQTAQQPFPRRHRARLGRFAQFALSIRKRTMFVRLYGLRAAIKMDLGKITGNTR